MLKLIYHQDYLTNYFTSMAESPVRITAIYNKLKDHYETVTPTPATREDILRVHTREHLEKVQQEGDDLYKTAMLSAGGSLCSAHLACEGVTSFALIRPPGHHARRSHFGGFCFFNNMAVALASLVHAEKIRSAAIIDFDMHYSDGTQDIFSDSDSISIIDVRAKERNHYLHLLKEEISRLPRIDLIGVSAGFDLYVRDWGMLLETSDFHTIGKLIWHAANEKASGRCFAILEGGYFLNDLGRNALAFCRGLEGREP